MKDHHRRSFLFAAIAIGLLPAAGAQAQYYGGAPQRPLYPYAVPNDRPYAVEVAPNTYVIRRSTSSRRYPYVGRNGGSVVTEPNAPALDRPQRKADRALIEELRKRAPVSHATINTRKIVRHSPLIVETQRVVDDPPRVIERRHVVEDAPAPAPRKRAMVEDADSKKRGGRDDNKKRVIQANAEITILGPDRMSIRLFRKGRGGNANVRAE